MARIASPSQADDFDETNLGSASLAARGQTLTPPAAPQPGSVLNPHLVTIAQCLGRQMAREAFAAAMRVPLSPSEPT